MSEYSSRVFGRVPYPIRHAKSVPRYPPMKTENLVLQNGAQCCVFEPAAEGAWKPGWFLLEQERHLRFKDHEWMSVGNLRADAMRLLEQTPRSLRFEAEVDYYGARVRCETEVSLPVAGPGFVVRSTLVPNQDVEILEALTSFETPYVFTGSEDTVTVIGMEPVIARREGKQVAGIEWQNPVWFYNRPGVARMTAPTFSPYVAQELTDVASGGRRRAAFLLDWNRSSIRDLYASPTRRVTAADYDAVTEFDFGKEQGQYGYKFIPGAFNWSSSLLKDPNLLVRQGELLQQTVLIDYSGPEDARTHDHWLLEEWSRLLDLTFPKDGRVEVLDIASRLGVSWGKAADALEDVLRQREVPGLWDEEKGIAVYIDGTRPKAGDLSMGFSLLWIAPAAYSAKWRGDEALLERYFLLADKLGVELAKHDPAQAFTLGMLFFVGLPALRLLDLDCGKMPHLKAAVETYLEGCLAPHARAEEKDGFGDYGIRSIAAHAFLLGGRVLQDERFQKRGLEIIRHINTQLEGDFWFFGCGIGEKCPAGHQARPLGYAHAILANLEAYRLCGDMAFLDAASRFANYAIALCFASANGSPVEDFDTRGWAHGAISGRDQLAEFPPYETCDTVRAIAALAEFQEDAPTAFYDLIWLNARTALGMMPAARTYKRVYQANGKPCHIPTEGFANERAIYARFPYVAYENPWDQTLQATYQGSEPLWHRLLLGEGIAAPSDPRLLVFIPAALRPLPLNPKQPLALICWNPTSTAIDFSLSVKTGFEVSGGGKLRLEARAKMVLEIRRCG